MSDRMAPSHWLIVEQDPESEEWTYAFRCSLDEDREAGKAGPAECDDHFHDGCRWCWELNRVITLSDHPRSAVLFAMAGQRVPSLFTGKVQFANNPYYDHFAASSKYVWRYFVPRNIAKDS